MSYRFPLAINVSGCDKKGHFALFVDIELVALGGSTGDEFSVLPCALLAASVPKILSLQV